MSADPAHPSGHSRVYAALHAASETAPGTDWLREAERVDQLIQSMWVSFVAAPTHGMPTELVDFVAAYTRAVRLRMTLLGYAADPRKPVAKGQGPAHVKVRQP